MEGLARIVNVWNAPEKYIIETVKRVEEEDVPLFSISFTERKLKFEQESPRVLDELDRKNVRYESGVDPCAWHGWGRALI